MIIINILQDIYICIHDLNIEDFYYCSKLVIIYNYTI